MCCKHHGLKNRRKLVGFHENQKGPGFQVCQKWVSWIKKSNFEKSKIGKSSDKTGKPPANQSVYPFSFTKFWYLNFESRINGKPIS
jgi:chlorite dismutase